MRILFIAHYTALYGANRSLLNLIEGLRNYKHNIHVLCPDHGELTQELQSRNINYTVSYFPTSVHYKSYGFLRIPIKIYYYFKFFINSKWVNKFAPEIIYSNSSVIYVGCIMSFIYNKPHIWHIREFGKEDYNLRYDLGIRIHRYIMKKSHAIIAISNAIKRKVSHKSFKSTIYVVHNGVISEKGIFDHKKQISDNVNIGIVGAIRDSKNQLEAIKAFKIFNDKYNKSRLHIYGSGQDSYLKILKDHIKKLGLEDSVIFRGYIRNTYEIYKDIDILLMCSRNEGLGRVTIEAMAFGIPVVGHRSGGTSELIQDSLNGYLYDNLYELSLYLDRIMNNKKHYSKMSAKCIDTVRKNFTNEIYSKKINLILEKTYREFY